MRLNKTQLLIIVDSPTPSAIVTFRAMDSRLRGNDSHGVSRNDDQSPIINENCVYYLPDSTEKRSFGTKNSVFVVE